MTTMKRRKLLISTAAACLGGAAQAQSAPVSTGSARPLRLLVPFAAGGATDITARALAGPLSQLLGAPVAVENRPGAAGATCMAEVAAAAPDGATLGVATLSTHGVTQPSTNTCPTTRWTASPPSPRSSRPRACWWCTPACRCAISRSSCST